jgi:hypothetical protein
MYNLELLQKAFHFFVLLNWMYERCLKNVTLNYTELMDIFSFVLVNEIQTNYLANLLK